MGIGTDNASVMVGINNGVFKILKEEYNLHHLILTLYNYLAVSHTYQEAIETIKRNKTVARIVHLAEAFCLIPEDIDKVLVQYRNIGEHEWENKDDTIKFWCEVLQCKDAAGNNLYQELGNLAK
ncbi:unnamed protein product [Pieris macdunnoughi]|uniref:Uncharacterized protein n=1 Tax=Pieris macdunnoughi TaxID=345717 RepID=A0A821QC21_9NEOP|nr:unnamed protein product [Pieris macdunnoughi]